jgi:hypothetical protein
MAALRKASCHRDRPGLGRKPPVDARRLGLPAHDRSAVKSRPSTARIGYPIPVVPRPPSVAGCQPQRHPRPFEQIGGMLDMVEGGCAP